MIPEFFPTQTPWIVDNAWKRARVWRDWEMELLWKVEI